ncbi:MAG TPA: hypothetical protein VEC57_12835 [Candidatus Limnocylindrales bacterium]|nr:hypothetical protein [Candidatus Limnocylindrales bacterium]
MSCSVHDVVRLEKSGIPTVAVATEAFVDEALDQSRLLGMPAYEVVYLPHPVAILDEENIRRLARETARSIIERLVA